jgi:hypothetical protein
MEKQLARIVNKGLIGEPENIVLQVKNTLEIFEFSQIKYVDEAGSIRNVTLIDDTLDQPEILHILNVLMHEVYISINENNEATIYF